MGLPQSPERGGCPAHNTHTCILSLKPNNTHNTHAQQRAEEHRRVIGLPQSPEAAASAVTGAPKAKAKVGGMQILITSRCLLMLGYG